MSATVTIGDAERFLARLDPDPEATFTFQTFDGSKQKRRELARVLHGTLAQHRRALRQLNDRGAGVFVTVNATNGAGRKAQNIVRVRALFVDLDGAPLEPVLQSTSTPQPHIVAESSPGRWHAYWRVDDLPLDAFGAMQKSLAERFGGDPTVHDLPRVMRLPGFAHRKGEPFETRIISIGGNGAYSADAFPNVEAKSAPARSSGQSAPFDLAALGISAEPRDDLIPPECDGLGISDDPDDFLPPVTREKIEAALAVTPSDDYQVWFEVGCAICRELGDAGYELFDAWSRKSRKYDAGACARKWSQCGKVQAFSAGTIFHHADSADKTWRDRLNVAKTQAKVEAKTEAKTEAPKDRAKVQAKLIQSSAEFVGNFVPPDYLIDGLVQRRFFYSLTAPTGAGKTCIAMRVAAHVALGLPLDNREVVKCRVLFFAGENPDDVRMRWIKLCEEMGQKPETMDVFFLPGAPLIGDAAIRKAIDAEAAKHGPFGFVIVDTSAAYFHGDDENSNAQLGAHARMLRTLVELPGGPSVIATCHPTKTPNMENLVPRGGGAYVNEVDGNFVALKDPDNMVVELSWHCKFRGPDFAPIPFKLQPGTSERLRDSKGRPIWTVTAAPISDEEKAAMENAGRDKQDALLSLMKAQPDLSIADCAKALGWFYGDGRPAKSTVQRTLAALKKNNLVENDRGQWALTRKGSDAAKPWQPVQAEMPI